MKKSVTKTLSYIFFMALGVGLFLLCFSNLNLSELWDSMRGARYGFVLLNVLFLAISLFFRALRWNLLIGNMNFRTRPATTYYAVLIAYMANIAVPRLGEVLRCGVLTKKERIPFDKSFGTVISERIIDIAFLFILIIVVILAQWKMLGALVYSWIEPLLTVKNLVKLVIVVSVLVSLTVAFVVFRRRNRAQLSQKKWYMKFSKLFHGMVEGIETILKLPRRQLWLFVLYTFLIWGFYVVMTWMPFYMLPETSHLGAAAAITILAITTIGFVAPVPGGVGTYHYIGCLLLTGFYGISEVAAVSFVTINHAGQTLFYIISGGLAYLMMFVVDRKKPLNN